MDTVIQVKTIVIVILLMVALHLYKDWKDNKGL